MSSKQFPASLDNLYEMLLFIKSSIAELNFPQRDVTNIELASEEALVNIINYGYPRGLGSVEISCLPVDSKGVKVVIKDHGVPYNPIENRVEVDTTASLESRSIGGYGVFFIVQMMDDVSYKREENTNILTLIKYSSDDA